MSVWNILPGKLELRLTSADPAAFLSALHGSGVTVYKSAPADEIRMDLTIHRRDLPKVEKLAQRRGDDLEITRRRGLYWSILSLRKRKLLVAGLLFFMALSVYLPKRILFIQVEGNQTVPTRLILEQAGHCGIGFGASRAEVRSEKMKNALLEAMPQLQWAGVNTRGCVAVISVREREPVEPAADKGGVSSLVAARDGVILSCTVTRGSAAVKVGQAVRAGQLLVSGYTDTGLSIRACRAEGEIYARTERSLQVRTPEEYVKKGAVTAQSKKISLIIGKKRINFYKSSGILGSSCDRIYKESYLTLPGGFVLPVTVLTEIWISREECPELLPQEEAAALASDFASEYLSTQMVAGEILNTKESLEKLEGAYRLNGQYACREMIGREQKEEILTQHGDTNGTDS